MARGRWPHFSRPKRSFMVSVSGKRETKSRVVSLSMSVAVISLSAIFSLIFMAFAIREAVALRRRSSFAILFVADLFHPVDIPAVNEFLNGDMTHSVGRGGAVPMLHTRRRPDHITRPYLPLVAIPFLHPTHARCDDQDLAGRMSMPGGSCARFKGDVAPRRAHRR